MNIAILIPELCGGGAERVAQIIGDYYVEQGNEVYYFVANTEQDYPVKGKIIQTNIKSCLGIEDSDIKRIIELFVLSLKLRRLKFQYKIEVSISFMEEFNYLNILSKGKEKVITRICTILSQRKELKGFLYKKKVVHFFYSKADRVIVMSQYALKDMVHHYHIPEKKIAKIPNPSVDLKNQECKKTWEFGFKTIVCVGRLEPVKQQEKIIRAFSYVCKKDPDVKLIFLGKGPLLNYLKGICAKLKIENNVIFVGFTDNIPYYLKHARTFVMASKVEGFPNSMIEAMHYGVPVITTNSPGACGEIVGKPKNLQKMNDITFCKYGILTPDMPYRKQKADLPLIEQEIILGEAMMLVLNVDKIYEKYRKQSFKRAEMFGIEKVIKKWNSIMDI